MDAGVIVAIVAGALVLVLVVALLARKGRERNDARRRIEAGEIRRRAQINEARAERHQRDAWEAEHNREVADHYDRVNREG